jgi:DNA repair protein RecO (recombination protein O)
VAPITTSAILLRAYPYSESSRILRFFTRDLGVVGVMARGARRSGAKGESGLETFAGGRLTVYVRSTRDLQTFKDFSVSRSRPGIGASVLRLGGASLVGEIVLRHAGEDANPVLFDALDGALDRLEATVEDRLIGEVLSEGWRLVSTLGYEPVLGECVECGEPLTSEETGRFDFGAGGLRCESCSDGRASGPRVGPLARAQLRALVAGESLSAELLKPRAHLTLLSDFITHHVSGGRLLESFAFLHQVVGDADA